jgi:KDO2-lipid IV(A) lauroyltransferase
MQAKMASAAPWKVRLYQWFFSCWFPIFYWLSQFPRLVLPLASLCMRFFFRLRPQYLQAIVENYRVIFPERSPQERIGMALAMVENHARYWVEFFKFGKPGKLAVETLLDNPEALEQVLNEVQPGQGAILITAHMGNWELGGTLFGRLVKPLTVIYVRDRFNIVERMRSKSRSSGRIRELPVDRSIFSTLPALRALEQGEFLALQGDRDFNDRGIEACFFGRKCTFPEGPYQLALLARVPVIPCFTLFAGPRRYRVQLFPAIPIPPEGKREERVRTMLNAYLKVLEEMVRLYPEQWYTFYPFFAASAGKPTGS